MVLKKLVNLITSLMSFKLKPAAKCQEAKCQDNKVCTKRITGETMTTEKKATKKKETKKKEGAEAAEQKEVKATVVEVPKRKKP